MHGHQQRVWDKQQLVGMLMRPHTHRRNDIGFEPENLALLQDKISASQNMY